MSNLSGKTALVTGGSRGIGRASAIALGKAGAQVLVHYGRAAKEAEAVVAQLREAGGRAAGGSADLGAPDGPHKLAKQVRGIVGERLDILVANAGISRPATIEETTVADFDELFVVNVRAPFFVVQQLLPILTEGSSIVFVSSLAAHRAVGALGLFGDQGSDRHSGEALRVGAGSAWHPRKRRRPGYRRDRHVRVRQDFRGPRLRIGNSGAQARGPTR